MLDSLQISIFSALKGLKNFRNLNPDCTTYMIFNGEPRSLSDGTQVLNFKDSESILSKEYDVF